MSQKLKIGLVLYLLGFIGILSMLTVQLPDMPQLARFSPAVVKLLVLAGPAIYLLVAVIVGTVLYNKVGLTVPAISAMTGDKSSSIGLGEQVKSGVIWGLVSGILITIVSLLFQSSLPESLVELSEKIKPTIMARFLYGGITEELLLRYGLMTLFVWLIFKVSGSLKPFTYWAGILMAAILFAFGHFPVVYMAVPEPSTALLIYVLTGNSIAGIFFGWLYWKKGLEAAFLGHIFSHVAMLLGEQLFSLV